VVLPIARRWAASRFEGSPLRCGFAGRWGPWRRGAPARRGRDVRPRRLAATAAV